MEPATKLTEYSRPVTEKVEGCTPVYRNVRSLDTLVGNFDPPIVKMYELFERSAKKFPKNDCFGS